jgi:hypothetical protein
VKAAVAALREYEAARELVANAWLAARSRPAAGKSLESERAGEREHEPTIVEQSFEMLVDVVRERLEGDLERDLVEAAARSPMGHDIQELPAHLQVLARERRFAIRKEIGERAERQRPDF